MVVITFCHNYKYADQVLSAIRHVSGELQVALLDQIEHLVYVVVVKRRRAHQQLVKNRAQPIDVRRESGPLIVIIVLGIVYYKQSEK